MRRTRSFPARRWIVGATMLVLVGAMGLIPISSVAAAEPTDTVLDWNLNAVNALSNPATATPPGAGQTPPVASIHLAMVQGAVYDAVNAIDGGHRPYLQGLPSAPASASKAAAAATAAHDVLVGLVPALPVAVLASIETLYAGSLLEITDGTAKTEGIAIGAAAAHLMLDERATDGRYGTFSFTPGTQVGEWRPELPAYLSDPFAWVARVRPFTLTSTSQFRTAGPNALTSAAYAADYNEVKALGGLTNSSRTADQTDLARFYSANPMPILNRTIRNVAAAQGLSITEDARLFALTSFSATDALINCWDDKDYWSFWRPITAIHEAADDGNPATSPQADWAPFFPTPPYPDHPSGYNCFTAAMMHTAQTYFSGEDVTIELTSPAVGVINANRTYKQFTAVLKDTIDARIYMGIHFRAPDEQGAWLGKKVANWVVKHEFELIR
jgi:hypothetical protein